MARTPVEEEDADGCVFCAIAAGKAPAGVVFRDGRCTAFMDIRPINPGHVLVIPNDHAASLSELAEDAGAHLFRSGQKVAAALYGGNLRCEGVNLFLADGEAAGQEVFHVHLHVLPRFEADGFGLSFGLSFGSDYGGQPARHVLDGMAEKVRNAL